MLEPRARADCFGTQVEADHDVAEAGFGGDLAASPVCMAWRSGLRGQIFVNVPLDSESGESVYSVYRAYRPPKPAIHLNSSPDFRLGTRAVTVSGSYRAGVIAALVAAHRRAPVRAHEVRRAADRSASTSRDGVCGSFLARCFATAQNPRRTIVTIEASLPPTAEPEPSHVGSNLSP